MRYSACSGELTSTIGVLAGSGASSFCWLKPIGGNIATAPRQPSARPTNMRVVFFMVFRSEADQRASLPRYLTAIVWP